MNFADERRLLAKVSRLYYKKDMTQRAIGVQLRISRQKVRRLLQRARDEEIVRTWIQPVVRIYAHLEEELAGRYGLQEALVVETTYYDDQSLVSDDLGAGTAEYLLRVVEANDRIVISNWGRAMAGTVEALRFSPFEVGEGVTIIHGLSELTYHKSPSGPSDITRELARVPRGKVASACPRGCGQQDGPRHLLRRSLRCSRPQVKSEAPTSPSWASAPLRRSPRHRGETSYPMPGSPT